MTINELVGIVGIEDIRTLLKLENADTGAVRDAVKQRLKANGVFEGIGGELVSLIITGGEKNAS